ANVSVLRGHFEDARKDLNAILRLDPRNAVAYVKLAQIALDSDQDAQAKTVLIQAIKVLPAEPLLRLALANYAFGQGQIPQPLGIVDELLRIQRNQPDALALRGQLLIAIGENSEATDTFYRLVANAPSSSSAQLMLAKALNSIGNRLGSEDAARKA